MQSEYSSNVHWCLQKALERTLVGDKSGASDYLEMAKLWHGREHVAKDLSKYFVEP